MPVHKHPFRTARISRTVPHEHAAEGPGNGPPMPTRGPVTAASPGSMQRWDVPTSRPRRGGPRTRSSAILRRYFGARGPHLAAMLAYYALLSLFPFVFLAASLVSWIGRPAETSALLRDLSHVLPGTSAHDLARYVRSLGLQRDGDRPDRRRRPAVVVARLPLGARIGAERASTGCPTAASCTRSSSCSDCSGPALIGLLAGLTVVVTSQTTLSQIAPGLSHLAAWRIGGGLAISTLTTFLFLMIVYRTLPNTEITTRQVLPGALIATVLLQLTFEALPLYVRSVEGLPALKAFGGAAVLLVWLYLMGNVVLLGGAITWWSARGRAGLADSPKPADGSAAGAADSREREHVGPLPRRGQRPAASGPRAARPGRSPGACGPRRRVGRARADRQHAHRDALPTPRRTARAVVPARHVDHVGVDRVARPAQAGDDLGAGAQRPLARVRPRPSRSARASRAAAACARPGSRRACRSPSWGWERPCRAAWRCARARSRPRPPSSRGASPNHRRRARHERRREGRPFGEGRLAGRRLATRRRNPDPGRRSDEIDERASRRPLPDLVDEPGSSAPTASTPGCEAGKVPPGRPPPLPAAATTSAPESCSACSDSTSAREGLRFAETLTTCAPCARSQANAASEAVLERCRGAFRRLDDARRQQRRVRHDADGSDVGAIGDEDTGDGRAVAHGVVRRRLAADHEALERWLPRREPVVVDARVGHADDDAGGGARREMDRAAPARIRLGRVRPTGAQPSPASEIGWSRST